MKYEIGHGKETYPVEVHAIGPHTYEVKIGDGETVKVDAFKTARTVYSILVGNKQYEGSVDERENGMLDVHLGTSAYDFTAVDERRKLLAGSAAAVATGKQEIRAQMPGKIVKVLVQPGASVEVDQGLVIMEAMKMENELKSPIAGVVTQIDVGEEDTVEMDALLIVVEPPEEG